MYKNNSVWRLFASVKLALVTLVLIAGTSIIGTVVPQNEAIEWYAGKYGPEISQLIAILDISDMYGSWWFLGLIYLLCINLVICSIDRFPGVWKQIQADGLSFGEERLGKMSNRLSWEVKSSATQVSSRLEERLSGKGWKAKRKTTEEGILLFGQKGAWTRTGVYFVHASILVIFLGAVIGAIGGFKGFVMLPEKQVTDKIGLYGGGLLDLGFAVRCNSFSIDFYANGMPKDYTSSLTVIENGQEILTKTIEVNDPLTYKGITFYQSSYEPYQDFVITVKNPRNGAEKFFTVPFQKQVNWPEEGLRFGVINAKMRDQSLVSSKIWFTDDKGSPTTVWADDGAQTTVKREAGEYLISAKQMYATGLQVAKDPGVWWVYLGCGLMMFGLYVAFFMSHRRIWLLITETEEGAQILFAGSANKNRPGFESSFVELTEQLRDQ